MQEDLSNKTEPTRIESLQLNSSVTSSSSKKLTMEKEMVELYQSIDLLLPAPLPKRVIQFIASRPREGTSTIARQFASIAVTKFNKSVLILELNDNHEAIYKITNSNSSISFNLIYQQDTMVNASIVKKHIDNEKVDFIVIDSESAAISSQGITISAIVDGVVLVVEAENTRWQVVDNLKHNIMKNKGNILGIVFNKRRFYIPDFIYRRF